MITEIDIEKITPHPKNPRKNIGDLEELTKSIRTFGVLQNLTVVPDNEDWDTFTVVCGHRRLAAAKKAALPKVPCVIMEMDEREQVAVMLMENMQRSDLTLQEEAQGFQMMLDLGASIRDIVQKTGMSETKIRHRIKLNELDQELLEKKMKGAIQINDLIKLEKLKDPANKKKALESIGTNNYEWIIGDLFKKEKKEYIMGKLQEIFPDAEVTENWQQYREVCSLEYEKANDEDIKEFAEKLRQKAEETGDDIILWFRWSNVGGMTKTERKTEQRQEEDSEYARRERTRKERIKKLEDMMERIGEKAEDFVCEISEEKAKKNMGMIMPFLAETLFREYYRSEKEDVLELMGKEVEEPESEGYGETQNSIDAAYRKTCEEEPHRTALTAAFTILMPGRGDLWSWEGKYSSKEGEETERLYKLLEALGYEAADEELDFIRGKSDLYLQEED